MAWRIYKEYTDLDFNSNFSMSFDFVLGNNETLGLGFRERTSIPSIRSMINFSKNLERNVLVSSSPEIFSVSNMYQHDNGLIIKRQVDNSSFFDKQTRIVNNKVYEEVPNVSNFDKEKYTDYFVEDKTLYVFYQNKYDITSNGQIGMVFNPDTMAFVFSSSNGNVFDEKYYTDGTFRGTSKKTRITISNKGKLINFAQKDNFFSTIFYIQFTEEFEHGFIFAGTEAQDGLNSLMTDICVFGTQI